MDESGLRLQTEIAPCFPRSRLTVEASTDGNLLLVSDPLGAGCALVYDFYTGRSIRYVTSWSKPLLLSGNHLVAIDKQARPGLIDIGLGRVTRLFDAPPLTDEERNQMELAFSTVSQVSLSKERGELRAIAFGKLHRWRIDSGTLIGSENYPEWIRGCTWVDWDIERERLFCQSPTELRALTPNLKVVWQMDVKPTSLFFPSQDRALVAIPEAERVVVLDAVTGATKHVLPLEPNRHKTVNFVAVSQSGRFAVLAGPRFCELSSCITCYDLATGRQLWTYRGKHRAPAGIPGTFFTRNGDEFVALIDDTRIKVYDPLTGRSVLEMGSGEREPSISSAKSNEPLASFQARVHLRPTIGSLSAQGLATWDLENGRLEAISLPAEFRSCAIGNSHDEFLLLICGAEKEKKLVVWELSARKGKTLNEIDTDGLQLALISQDASTIATFSEIKCPAPPSLQCGSQVKVFRVQDGALLSTHPVAPVDSLLISPDGRSVVAMGRSEATILDRSGAAAKKLNIPFQVRDKSTIVGANILVSGVGVLAAYDLKTGKWKWTLRSTAPPTTSRAAEHEEPVVAFGLLSSGRVLAQGVRGNVVELDVDSGKPLGRYKFVKGPTGHFVAVAGDRYLFNGTGLFERKTGELVAALQPFGELDWVVVSANGRFDASDLDRRIPAHWITADDPLRPLPIENFMREYYMPRLLSSIVGGTAMPTVKPITQLNRALPSVQIESVAPAGDSVVEVRIKIAQGYYTPASEGASPSKTSRRRMPSGARDLKLFRNGFLVAFVPGDLLSGQEETVVSRLVRVPLDREPSHMVFSAYSFNSEMVKSQTAQASFNRSVLRTDSTRPSRAFILSIGVNSVPQSKLALEHAVNDAQRFASEVSRRVGVPAIPSEVRILASDSASPNGASKKAIQEALEGLRKSSQPEDFVILFFAGHGFTGDDGQFYLVPSDAVDSSQATLQSSSISSNELTEWLREIDAKELILILDACQSAASVATEGFKPGPMTSAGLGQLAYDKRMRILAASQSDGVALEFGSLKHGLLTYTLLVEGLQNQAADWQPKDGEIVMGEWLKFAEQAVPSLAERISRGEPVGRETRLGWTNGILLSPQKLFQRPSLFDFRRRSEGDIVIGR
jgi:outer membrane protein assembly factor BamB